MTELDLIQSIPVLLEKPFLEPGDRLVCFGDSLTARPNGYFHFLKEALEPKGIELINSGLGGDKMPAALTRLERDSQGLYYTCDGMHHTPRTAELIAKAMLHCWRME